MKIAFPAACENGTEQQVCGHFGPSPWFIVIDGSGKALKPIRNTSSHFGGAKMPPELLRENGIDAIVCCDMGPKAVAMCGKLGIDVYFCPVGITAGAAFRLYSEGKLRKAGKGDGCKDHKD